MNDFNNNIIYKLLRQIMSRSTGLAGTEVCGVQEYAYLLTNRNSSFAEAFTCHPSKRTKI